MYVVFRVVPVLEEMRLFSRVTVLLAIYRKRLNGWEELDLPRTCSQRNFIAIAKLGQSTKGYVVTLAE